MILWLAACSTPPPTVPVPPPVAPLVAAKEVRVPVTVVVVRHAEKETTGGDVPLTAAGQERAERLAVVLADLKLGSVHSTDTLRTRSTGAPTAAAHGLKVELYDHEAPEALVGKLEAMGGAHLVVGHSNTVPALVTAFGGDGGTPIVEASEFDRLYLVTRQPEGPTATSLLRY